MRKTMNKTNKESYFEDPLAVDSTGLQELVGAGRRTATVIGMAAGAKIKVGKRVLWNVNKVKSIWMRFLSKVMILWEYMKICCRAKKTH